MSSSSPCTSDEMMTDKDHLRQQIISKAEDHIRSVLSGDSSGHDFDHINRVRALAVLIGKSEGANVYLCELGALLHDIADWKFHGGDEFAGGKAARNFLEGIGVNATDIEAIVHIVDNMSFKGAAVKSKISSLEGRCVQDAGKRRKETLKKEEEKKENKMSKFYFGKDTCEFLDLFGRSL